MRSEGKPGDTCARVDVRYDAAPGERYVLEVNSNRGISCDEIASVGGILQLSGTPANWHMGAIVRDAPSQHRRQRREVPVA